MIITMRPGSVTVAAGTATCASTLAMATAVPGFSPVQRAACSVSPPAFWPIGRMSRVIFSSTTFSKRGSRALKILLGREAFALRPDGLVTGGAGVARLHAGQLPDHPVGGFDQAVGGGVDFGGFIQDLQDLGEEPFGGDLAAVAVQPALPHLAGGLVDLVGFGLGGVVFPQLHPGVRTCRGIRAGRTAACRRL